MMTPSLTKSFTAGAAITRRRIIKFGAAEGQVLMGAAATDPVFGVSTDIDSDNGRPSDVHMAGIVEIEAGGTVSYGDRIAADATGRAVAAAPAAGVNNNVVGFALVNAVVGDVFPVMLAPAVMQGA